MLNVSNEDFDLSGSEIHARNGKLKIGCVGVEIIDHMSKLACEPG